MRRALIRLVGILGAIAGGACGRPLENEPTQAARDPVASPATTPLALVGVRVVPMTSNVVLVDQTIIVRDGVVTALGPSAATPVPAGATVVTAGGRYVMPALIDMHVHLSSADLDAYVNAGIGTVRNMWGFASIATMQRDIEAGARVGPTIISASPGLDGPPTQWPGTLLITDAREARALVRAQADAGWPYLKVYTRLTPEVFDSVMVAARSFGITPIGHVPFEVDVLHAMDAGMKSIEHFTGYDRVVSRTRRAGTWGWADADPSRFASLVEATVRAGVWNCPTLAIFDELAKQHTAAERAAIVRNRGLFVRELSRAGARILLGTDAGIDVVAPGESVHDELREMVAAGLTPFDALRAGTTSAAEFLGRPDLGRVAVGARADLLLLEGNPLADVANAHRMDGVVLRGAWRPASRGAVATRDLR